MKLCTSSEILRARKKGISFKPLCENYLSGSLEGRRIAFSAFFIDSRIPQWLSAYPFPVLLRQQLHTIPKPDVCFGRSSRKGKKVNS